MCARVCRNGVTFEFRGTKLPSRNIPLLRSHQQRLNVFKVRIGSVVNTSCSWQRCFYFRKIYARLFLKFCIMCARVCAGTRTTLPVSVLIPRMTPKGSCFHTRSTKMGIICSRLRGEAEASPRTVCFQSPHFPLVLCYLIV